MSLSVAYRTSTGVHIFPTKFNIVGFVDVFWWSGFVKIDQPDLGTSVVFGNVYQPNLCSCHVTRLVYQAILKLDIEGFWVSILVQDSKRLITKAQQ